MNLKDAVVAEFERLEEDLLYTEKAQFAASEHFKALHYVLGGIAAVASALTAASALNDRPKLAAALSIGAAIAAALVTVLKPEATAAHNVESARKLGDLRFRIRQARLLDAHDDSLLAHSELRELAASFTAEKQKLLADAPTTGPIAFRRARRRIEKGRYEYETDAGATDEAGA